LALKPVHRPADTYQMTTNILHDGERHRIDHTTIVSVEGLTYPSPRDVTDRNTIEAALGASGGFGRWEWDITAEVIRWSAQLCCIYGVDPGGQHSFEKFLSFVHPDDRARIQATVQTAYETRQPYSLEHRIVRPDGLIRLLYARGEVIADDAKRPLRMLGTGQDITGYVQEL
jgi:PAS domain S-box-containing protein